MWNENATVVHDIVLSSGSEAGSYVWLIDFVYHSTLGLRVIKKRRRMLSMPLLEAGARAFSIPGGQVRQFRR